MFDLLNKQSLVRNLSGMHTGYRLPKVIIIIFFPQMALITYVSRRKKLSFLNHLLLGSTEMSVGSPCMLNKLLGRGTDSDLDVSEDVTFVASKLCVDLQSDADLLRNQQVGHQTKHVRWSPVMKMEHFCYSAVRALNHPGYSLSSLSPPYSLSFFQSLHLPRFPPWHQNSTTLL